MGQKIPPAYLGNTLSKNIFILLLKIHKIVRIIGKYCLVLNNREWKVELATHLLQC